jgi:hypothetical protein
VGVESSITGTATFRAGGGGGSTQGGYTSTGGNGGGGNGSSAAGQAGTANTGGGGGAGERTSAVGGPGGSGVVILKTSDGITATFSGGVTQTNTTSGGFKIYTITAAGVSDTVTFN